MSEVWDTFGDDTYVPEEKDMGTPEEWQEIERDPALFEELRQAFGLPPRRRSEPNQEPIKRDPIPPYDYPTPPGTRSGPGGNPERRERQDPELSHDQVSRTEIHSPTPEVVYVPVPSPAPTPLPRSPMSEVQRPIPVQAVPVILHHPAQTAQPEVPTRTSPPLVEVPQKTEVPHTPEEKTSARKNNLPPAEEKASGTSKSRKTLKLFNGRGGRKHTEKQIEEILDWYLQTGVLPHYVSDRQRRSYKHHRTLPERRKLLEQQGIILVVPEAGANQSNVIPLGRANTQGGRRASGSV